MVLVTDKPSNGMSILQTKRSDRKGYDARCVGLQTVPLDQDLKGRHGACEPGVEIRPDPMHDLFAMADERQHRPHRLHQHAVLPLPALTEFAVGGGTRSGMETSVAQDHPAPVDLLNEPLQGVSRHMRRRTIPPYHQAILVQPQTEFPPDNPTMVGQAFATNVLRTPTLPDLIRGGLLKSR